MTSGIHSEHKPDCDKLASISNSACLLCETIVFSEEIFSIFFFHMVHNSAGTRNMHSCIQGRALCRAFFSRNGTRSPLRFLFPSAESRFVFLFRLSYHRVLLRTTRKMSFRGWKHGARMFNSYLRTRQTGNSNERWTVHKMERRKFEEICLPQFNFSYTYFENNEPPKRSLAKRNTRPSYSLCTSLLFCVHVVRVPTKCTRAHGRWTSNA